MRKFEDIAYNGTCLVYYNGIHKGNCIGYKDREGYMWVRINGKNKFAHRVIWELNYGPIPQGMQIDHINGIRDDNRLVNLRICTKAENGRNVKRKRNNVSGYIGVRFKKENKKWVANIKQNGKQVHLGYFGSAEEAYRARVEAEKKVYGAFSPHVCRNLSEELR